MISSVKLITMVIIDLWWWVTKFRNEHGINDFAFQTMISVRMINMWRLLIMFYMILQFKYLIMRSKICITLKRWTILIDLMIRASLPRNVSSLIPSLKAFSNSLRLCVRCTFEQMMNFGSHKKFRSDQTQRSLYL